MFVQISFLVVVGALFLCCGEPALGNWALWGTSYHFWENPTLWRKPYSWGNIFGNRLVSTTWPINNNSLTQNGPTCVKWPNLLGKVGLLKVFILWHRSHLLMTIYVIRLRTQQLRSSLTEFWKCHPHHFWNLTWGGGGTVKKITQASSIGIALGTSLGTYF